MTTSVMNAKERFKRSLECGACNDHDEHDVCDLPDFGALVEWMEEIEMAAKSAPPYVRMHSHP